MPTQNNKLVDINGAKVLYDDLRDRVEEKLDAPDTAGTSGQVLTSDGQGGQAWANPPACDISDVQMNGTSIVSNGVANIPIATDSSLGVVYPNGTSLKIVAGGILGLSGANSSKIKNGTDSAYPIMPNKEHEAAFYGLSKLAGVDLASETVTVGTYPEASKTAIQTMLGIEKGVTLVETVSGTTPTITAQPNVRYNCGTVSTISITPPSAGTCDILFTSGSTAAVLTVPNTVKWPVWFNASSLVADTIYEIMITDGVYGSVMTWAAS